MAVKPLIVGVDNLMAWFDDRATTAYYAILTQRKEIVFVWNRDDKEAGRERLDRDLEQLEQANYNEPLIIRLYDALNKNGGISKDTEYIQSIVFAVDAGNSEPVITGLQRIPGQDIYKTGKVDRILESLEGIKAQNDVIIAKNIELEKRLAYLEEDEGPGGEDNSLYGMVSGLLKEPQFKQLFIAGIGKILNINQPPGRMASVGAVAQSKPPVPPVDNANDERLVQDAIVRLRKVNPAIGSDLQLLATLAEKHPDLFNGLIDNLRSWE